MITIFKYPFKIQDSFTISMPKGAKVLSVQIQSGIPCMWAQVDNTKPKEDREFFIIGTGNLVPSDKLIYIDTFQYTSYVWHLYE